MARPLRKGMWAAYADGGIGIINGFTVDGKIEFHRVGPEGLTELVLIVDPGMLVQARWREIPESRRPDRKAANKSGYQ